MTLDIGADPFDEDLRRPSEAESNAGAPTCSMKTRTVRLAT
jgi:hypothetical protein